jgi:uncharacterized protein (UPF0335 family)
MFNDLFESHLTRDELLDIYVDTVTVMRGFPPKDEDLAGLGRAALVDRIERLSEEAQARRRARAQASRALA